MIYYQDIVQAEPGMMDRYLKIFGEKALPPLLERGNKPIGMYRVVPGTGTYNEVIFINGIDDWRRWGKDVATTEGHPNRDEWHPGVRSWAEMAFDYRKRWIKNFYFPAPFAPSHEQLMKRKKNGATFIHLMYRVTPGKMEQWLDFAGSTLKPAWEKQGMELITFLHIFPGTGPSDQCVELWAVKDWNDWSDVVQARQRHLPLKRALARALAFRDRWDERTLLPAPWSPVQ